MSMEFWVALAQIMMVNIVLSGDNAVVIALAARGLPEKQQKTAVLWGSGGAVVLRIALTVIAVALLKIPYLQAAGGLLLVWIAYQLLTEEEEAHDESAQQSGSSLMSAVKTILIADVVMSLDNTLAIAGVANGDWTLLIIGLALSIPLVVFGSTIIMKLMDRFPVIVYIGAGLIAYTAGEMIEADKALQPYLPHFLHGAPYLAIALAVAVVGYGWWYNNRKGRTAHDVLEADERIAENLTESLEESQS